MRADAVRHDSTDSLLRLEQQEGGAAPQDDVIRVVCRFRPSDERETREGGQDIVQFDPSMTMVQVNGKDYPSQYAFDRIFAGSSAQADVFGYAAQNIIQDVMMGYNGTLFCYGQTGSGKTHTMMGDLDDADMCGLIPRVVQAIFAAIFAAPSSLEFSVKLSFMEIYMERIRDLLQPGNDNLPVHEERGRGVFVKGLSEVFVGSVDEVFAALRQGQSTRATAATSM
jgi:kinesin family member 5